MTDEEKRALLMEARLTAAAVDELLDLRAVAAYAGDLEEAGRLKAKADELLARNLELAARLGAIL